MKKQAAIAVLVAITWAMSAATGVAQSVSGLSVKTREAAEPVAAAAPDMTSKTVIDLFAEYLAAGSNEERDALLARISRLRIAVEDNKATELARKRAEARQAIIDAPDEATRQERKRALARLRADDPPVSLAVPAGATAAVGEDKSATAGPVLGFQAWRPDDFFAGAFFTFDTPARLNGDGRRANEFLRNPPATGTSFYLCECEQDSVGDQPEQRGGPDNSTPGGRWTAGRVSRVRDAHGGDQRDAGAEGG